MSNKDNKDINEHLVLVVAMALVMIISIGGLALVNNPALAKNASDSILGEVDTIKQNITSVTTKAGNIKIDMPKPIIPKIELPKIQLPQIELPPFDLSEILLPIKQIPDTLENKVEAFFMGVGKEIQSFEQFAQKVSSDTASLFTPPAHSKAQLSEFIEIAMIEGEAISLNEIVTSVGEEKPMEYADIQEPELGFPIEQEELSTEGVLVPKQKTVISSSRDGKIAKIFVDNGDVFKKGDTLLEYDCKDARSEVAIAKLDKEFKKKQLNTTMRLLKLDLISDLESDKVKTETEQAKQKERMVRTKLDHCYIVATYDGRVVRRLANANEYTRTDRVLLEVASINTMDVEFLIPSKWLRWVNIDAPFSLTLNETGKSYEGVITRIYGEVDPVSQSIQIRGSLKEYKDRLLPGMSGSIDINAMDVREAGVLGYLEASAVE